jgi:uncharacterized protein
MPDKEHKPSRKKWYWISGAMAGFLVIASICFVCLFCMGHKDIWAAAGWGDIGAVKGFLDRGVDVNAKCSVSGGTPIHSAARTSRNDVIKLLLNRGGDINARNNDGYTPLQYADSKTTVVLLLARGADVNAAGYEYGLTPLQGALEMGNNAVAELLISAGADLEAKYDNSRTPLVRAIGRGDYHIIKFILDHGADVNTDDGSGGTALHYAVHRDQAAVLELLIAKGANINAVTINNKTPLDYAEEDSKADMAACLRKHGGKTGKELKEEKQE